MNKLNKAINVLYEHLNTLTREEKCAFLHLHFLDDSYPSIDSGE